MFLTAVTFVHALCGRRRAAIRRRRPHNAAEDQQRLADILGEIQRLQRAQREALALSVEGELRSEQTATIGELQVLLQKRVSAERLPGVTAPRLPPDQS